MKTLTYREECIRLDSRLQNTIWGWVPAGRRGRTAEYLEEVNGTNGGISVNYIFWSGFDNGGRFFYSVLGPVIP